jgi:hypothetical protein
MAGNRLYQTILPMFLTVPGEYSSPFIPQLVTPLLKSHGRHLEIAVQAYTKQFSSQFFKQLSASQSKPFDIFSIMNQMHQLPKFILLGWNSVSS